MKILITGGGTTEKIDSMRVITNKSSGRTSLFLANTLSLENDVTLLLAENIQTEFQGRVLRFTSCDDLYNNILSLKSEHFDMIIHAAAVGDYEVSHFKTSENISTDKIPSGLTDLTLHLRPTKKIINEIKKNKCQY